CSTRRDSAESTSQRGFTLPARRNRQQVARNRTHDPVVGIVAALRNKHIDMALRDDVKRGKDRLPGYGIRCLRALDECLRSIACDNTHTVEWKGGGALCIENQRLGFIVTFRVDIGLRHFMHFLIGLKASRPWPVIDMRVIGSTLTRGSL